MDRPAAGGEKPLAEVDRSEAATSNRDIPKRLDTEVVDTPSGTMSKRELELRLQAEALKGDLRAMRVLDDKRSALKLDQPA